MASTKKFLDQTGLAYFWLQIKSALSGKVDTENGKGLSSNDYTSEEKTKLAGIETGADVNVLEGVQVNGSTITPTNKIANIPVPTATSDLTNDSGFITTADIPEGSAASTTIPIMDGTASIGSELAFARGDHVHPSDTSKVDKVSGKQLSTEDYTSAEKTKLAGIDTGAEVNQNAFSSIKVGSTTVSADTKTDTLELIAGSNVTLTPDATNDSVTISSAAPAYTGSSPIDVTGSVIGMVDSGVTAGSVGDTTAQTPAFGSTFKALSGTVTAKGILTNLKAHNVTIPNSTASTSAAGLMSAIDKTKLNGIKDVLSAIAIDTQDNQDVIKFTTNGSVPATYTAPQLTELAKYAPLASPALTGAPTAPTASAGTNTTQIATTAFVTSEIASAQVGAAMFQDVINAGTEISSLTDYKKGWYWVVGTAGTYVGETCEAGDMIFCVSDYNSAYSASDFSVVQSNLDMVAITTSEIDTIVAS